MGEPGLRRELAVQRDIGHADRGVEPVLASDVHGGACRRRHRDAVHPGDRTVERGAERAHLSGVLAAVPRPMPGRRGDVRRQTPERQAVNGGGRGVGEDGAVVDPPHRGETPLDQSLPRRLGRAPENVGVASHARERRDRHRTVDVITAHTPCVQVPPAEQFAGGGDRVVIPARGVGAGASVVSRHAAECHREPEPAKPESGLSGR